MGFRLADRIDLVFAGKDGNPLPAYDECQVAVRAITVGDYEKVIELTWDDLLPWPDHDERLRALLTIVVDSLLEWNLTNTDGTPTPHTVDGLLDNHPKSLVFDLINAWRVAQRDGPAPFELPSSDGAPLAEIPVQSLAS